MNKSTQKKVKLFSVNAAVVLAIHGGATWAITQIKVPEPKPVDIEKVEPIEVQIVDLPDEEEPVEVVVSDEPPPTQIENVSKPIKREIIKPRTLDSSQSTVNQTATAPKTSNRDQQKSEEKHAKNETQKQDEMNTTPLLQDNTLTVNESKQTIQTSNNVQSETSKSTSGNDHSEELERQRLAQIKAEQEREAQRRADEARRRAEERARAEAERLANTPVSISISSIRWKNKPRFDFPSRARGRAESGQTYHVTLLLTIGRDGSVTNATVQSSSGISALDHDAMRTARRGTFHPYKENGVARIAEVRLPVDYKVP